MYTFFRVCPANKTTMQENERKWRKFGDLQHKMSSTKHFYDDAKLTVAKNERLVQDAERRYQSCLVEAAAKTHGSSKRLRKSEKQREEAVRQYNASKEDVDTLRTELIDLNERWEKMMGPDRVIDLRVGVILSSISNDSCVIMASTPVHRERTLVEMMRDFESGPSTSNQKKV